MKKPLLAALSLVLFVSACGGWRDSRINPRNWFGGSQQAEPVATVAATSDPRALADQVLSLQVEPMLGGAIVRATGLPPTQGWWDAELVAQPVDENGVLVYDFRIFPPLEKTAVSTQFSREVTVAAYLSNTQLEYIRQITVQGAQNARTSRR